MLLPLACNHRRHREFHAVVGCHPTLSHGHYPTLNPFLHWLTALLKDVAVLAQPVKESLSSDVDAVFVEQFRHLSHHDVLFRTCHLSAEFRQRPLLLYQPFLLFQCALRNGQSPCQNRFLVVLRRDRNLSSSLANLWQHRVEHPVLKLLRLLLVRLEDAAVEVWLADVGHLGSAN